MKHLHTFESYSGSLIASVEVRSGDYVITGLNNRLIMRRPIASGETLVGFSSDIVVTRRGNDLITFTPELNRISAMTLGINDVARGVIGPNILVYKDSIKSLVTYDKNFRTISSYGV